jgi:trehalose 6-phosphate synthase
MPSIEPKNEARLLLVSNRLPITIKRSEDGKYDFSMSSGGLVSGLSGLSKSTTFQWYGWPGLEVPEAEIPVVTQRLKDEYGAVPVFIDDELADRHYNGFSSQLLLPTMPLECTLIRFSSLRLHPLALVSLSPWRDYL